MQLYLTGLQFFTTYPPFTISFSFTISAKSKTLKKEEARQETIRNVSDFGYLWLIL
jgi:hypothetical protein